MLVSMCIHITGFDGNGISYDQSSIIYEPLGEKISPIYSKKESAIYDINLQNVHEIRSNPLS